MGNCLIAGGSGNTIKFADISFTTDSDSNKYMRFGEAIEDYNKFISILSLTNNVYIRVCTSNQATGEIKMTVENWGNAKIGKTTVEARVFYI